MDNLTHTLVGLAAAKAGLERLSLGATAVCLVAANSPDVDIVALAQARESDGEYDAAAAAYRELAAARDPKVIPADTANLRLASVLEKQGKKQEAVELLFQIVKTAREARDKDGKPVAPSASARSAEDQLEKLDPARHAQLPPEEKVDNLIGG